MAVVAKGIDLKAADRALQNHFVDSAALREKLLLNVTNLKRVYNGSLSDALKSLKAQVKAIDSNRKDRRDKARQAYYQKMRTTEGTSFETYQAELTSIDNAWQEQKDKATEAADKTITEAADQFQTDSQEVIAKYKSDLEDCVAKLAAEHP